MPTSLNDPLDAAGRALFELGRAFNRMPRRDLGADSPGPAADLGMIVLTQVVADAQTAADAVTVGSIAARLALDPSTASRLVARGVDHGLLDRRPSASDARAVVLSLTPSGERLAADAARYQRSIFDAATAGWSPEGRTDFARRFVSFSAAVVALTVSAQERP